MTDDGEPGCGLLGCALLICVVLVCAGFVGLAWKFAVWCWS